MNSLPLDLDLNLLRVLVQVHADRKVSLACRSLRSAVRSSGCV